MSAVAVAMSGGVDSSVACLLLKREGHEVVGFTFELLRREAEEMGPLCCSPESVHAAWRVCELLGIRHYVLNLRKEFEQLVIEPCCEDYSLGRTPNPCILCNEEMKFGIFLRKAQGFGMAAVATGHYAQIRYWEGEGWQLLRGSDPEKDQSYFLYGLGQEQLARIKMPLGGLTKREVRLLAATEGLPTAESAESQDLCFVGEGGLRAFLRRRVGDKVAGGTIVGPDGGVMGKHEGLCYYTIGQRRGVGVAAGDRLYVTALDPSRGEDRMGRDETRWARELLAEKARWVAGGPPEGGRRFRCLAQIRYRTAPAAAVVEPVGEERISVSFEKPQRAITPGQTVVLYQDRQVLGGGRIISAVNDN